MKTFSNKSPKEVGAMQTLYFTPKQTRELLVIGKEPALVLMQQYVAIAHQPNPNMEDSTLATILNKSEGTIKNTRLILTKAKWFNRIKTTVKGEIHIMYDVGKQAVASNSYFLRNSKFKETNSDNKIVTEKILFSD